MCDKFENLQFMLQQRDILMGFVSQTYSMEPSLDDASEEVRGYLLTEVYHLEDTIRFEMLAHLKDPDKHDGIAKMQDGIAKEPLDVSTEANHNEN